MCTVIRDSKTEPAAEVGYILGCRRKKRLPSDKLMWGSQFMSTSQRKLDAEEFRICETYAKRHKTISPDRYSRFNPASLFHLQQIERRLLRSLSRFGCTSLADKRILDVGCGSGQWLQTFLLWQARPENLFGVDLLIETIVEARHQLPIGVTLKVGNATRIDFVDQSFDLVFQFTVFSSILEDAMRRHVACEMLRVTERGGCIVWFDLSVDNPFNRDIRGIGKAEIRELFPQCKIHFERLTFVAPVARALPALCPVLSAVNIFSTHYLAFIRKN